MFIYTGKTALITGASSGIGEAFAKELASRGTNLILVARSHEVLQRLAGELTKQYKVRTEVIVADLTDPAAIYQIKLKLEKSDLAVDILVNNAGFGTYEAFEVIEPERDHQQVMLNVTAVVDLTHALIPQMAARKAGAIINVSSMAAFMPLPYMAVYAASKAFLLSFSQALWAEYRQQGIRVVALCPGQVETAFHTKMEGEVPTGGVKVSPQATVKAALQALEKGKSCVVPGRLNFFSIQLTRFLPRSFLTLSSAARLRPARLKN